MDREIKIFFIQKPPRLLSPPLTLEAYPANQNPVESLTCAGPSCTGEAGCWRGEISLRCAQVGYLGHQDLDVASVFADFDMDGVAAALQIKVNAVSAHT